MSTFKKIWTREFVESLLDEYIENSHTAYLCLASERFNKVWRLHHKKVKLLARKFISDANNKLGKVCKQHVLFACPFLQDRRVIRIKFLKYEIKRLSKS